MEEVDIYFIIINVMTRSIHILVEKGFPSLDLNHIRDPKENGVAHKLLQNGRRNSGSSFDSTKDPSTNKRVEIFAKTLARIIKR